MSKHKCILCGNVIFKLKRHLVEVHKLSEDGCLAIMSKRSVNVHREIGVTGFKMNNQVVYTRSKVKTRYRRRCDMERNRKTYDINGDCRTTFVPVKKSFPFADEFCECLATSATKRRVKEVMCFLEKLWMKMPNTTTSALYIPKCFEGVFIQYADDHRLASASRRRYAWHVIRYLNAVREIETDSTKRYRLNLTIKKMKQLAAEYKKLTAKESFIKNLEACE